MSDRETVLCDSEATERHAAARAAELRPGDQVLLEGPLGAGKTTWVRGLVRALGGDPEGVCSPTFVLLETYAVRANGIDRVHHADLYRLRGMASAPWDEVGLGEALDDSAAVTAIEWPEAWAWKASPGSRVLRVRLSVEGEARRAVWAWRG
ncbi:MAG: tRNA (adenosine(37)-N6)-threonylcarbamoyltransferase complex ATPase subunit type 1 TsaE [Acidobacteriota bacterium]